MLRKLCQMSPMEIISWISTREALVIQDLSMQLQNFTELWLVAKLIQTPKCWSLSVLIKVCIPPLPVSSMREMRSSSLNHFMIATMIKSSPLAGSLEEFLWNLQRLARSLLLTGNLIPLSLKRCSTTKQKRWSSTHLTIHLEKVRKLKFKHNELIFFVSSLPHGRASNDCGLV